LITNAKIAPYTSERKNRAFFEMYLKNDTLLTSYPSKKILSASLIQECFMRQKSIPRTELDITLDNSDGFFDLTDMNNPYYSLDEYSSCNFYLSSVTNGIDDEYVKKSRLFFSEASQRNKTISFKYTDLLSQPKFINDNYYIIDVFDELGKSSLSAKQILEGGISECKYNETVFVADEVNEVMNFSRSSFLNADNGTLIKDGFYEIAQRITNASKTPTYLIINDDGTLSLTTQKNYCSEIITPANFIDYEVLPGNGCLILKVRDRGNILRQLSDVIEVHDGSKTFKAEIYKQSFDYKNGILSAEWEGVIM